MQIGDRKVFLRTGPRTQTVSVCDRNDRRGDYDWVLRVFSPESVTQVEIEARASVEDLVSWLRTTKQAEVEKEPPVEAAETGAEPPPALLPPTDVPWIGRAVSIVDQAIDQLVFEFLRSPYLHRVEHSLHARLFSILAAQPHFDREFRLQDGRTVTQPIHKEWPETIPEDDCRRGNFDLAVLPPGLLAQCSVDAFRKGNVAPPIAIEMGLDYGPAHLAADAEKLIHSRVPHGYLIHFTRRSDGPLAERLVLDPGGAGSIKAAFASIGTPARFKLVRGTAIETADPMDLHG